jgi:hypothetical protein
VEFLRADVDDPSSASSLPQPSRAHVYPPRQSQLPDELPSYEDLARDHPPPYRDTEVPEVPGVLARLTSYFRKNWKNILPPAIIFGMVPTLWALRATGYIPIKHKNSTSEAFEERVNAELVERALDDHDLYK